MQDRVRDREKSGRILGKALILTSQSVTRSEKFKIESEIEEKVYEYLVILKYSLLNLFLDLKNSRSSPRSRKKWTNTW